MKIATLAATAFILSLGAPTVFAQEPPPAKCPKCEAMKKKVAAKAEHSSEVAAQSAELDKLVTEMNGSLGSKKIEAIAAVVTRLVEQSKALNAAKAAPQTEPAKEQAHQH